MKITHISVLLLSAMITVSCSRQNTQADATGTFEAVETIIPCEANGVIKTLNIEEGKELQAGEQLGYIDSTQLYLKKKQLEAQVAAVLSKRPDVNTQLAALKEQLKQAMNEQQRITRMVKADAATAKQLDDANAQVSIMRSQLEAQQSALNITVKNIGEETSPLALQVAQVNDQLSKCRIINPVKGTVLTTYAETNEMAVAGKALYKIADLSQLILRAYVTGDQFAAIKTGQQVQVLVDRENGSSQTYAGTIEWISNKAEFTPKTIQTKDERANLVYAIKIRVKNDGLLKIGMYGEVKLTVNN